MKRVQRRVVHYTGPGIYALDVMPHGVRGDYAILISLASVSGPGLELVSIGLPDSQTGAFSVEGEAASFYALQLPDVSKTLLVGEFTGLATLALPVVVTGTTGDITLYVDISRLGRDQGGNGNGP